MCSKLNLFSSRSQLDFRGQRRALVLATLFVLLRVGMAECPPHDRSVKQGEAATTLQPCIANYVNLNFLHTRSVPPFASLFNGDARRVSSTAQSDTNPSHDVEYPAAEKKLFKNLIIDQKRIWSSPFKVTPFDLLWLAPAGALTGAAIATDLRSSHYLRSSDPNAWQSYSNYGLAGMAGLAGSAYLFGIMKHDSHAHEAGLLSGEAALDTLAVGELLKFATGRRRPDSTHPGDFFDGGDSFPSAHALLSWSTASVLAHEYPGWLTQLSVYGLAGFTSVARIRGDKHFVSDSLVGAGIGWLVGREVYNLHHDPDLGGSEVTHWKFPHWQQSSNSDQNRTPDNMGSPYVPIDNWTYPVFDRLIALGYIRSGFLGERPWTRLECARLTQEATDFLADDALTAGIGQTLVKALQEEFAEDIAKQGGASNIGAAVESVYARGTDISGVPLTDGFHFGQTILNDYGRPYGEGFSSIGGASGRATAGPFAIYLRAEFQSSPSNPAEPLAARTASEGADFLSVVAPDIGTPSISRGRLLEGYVTLNLKNFQFSFGKQSLWWGPDKGGPMAFSNNAEPMPMFRIDRVKPIELPWIFRLLGIMRLQFFLAQQSGIRFIGPFGDYNHFLNPQPYIHGEKVSFKPTPNFEFSFSRTTIFAGEHSPFTLHHFIVSLFGNGTGEDRARLGVDDPGDRRSFVDFSYRIPGLRQWLTLYTDGFTDDEISPIGYPRKAAFNPGIYIPQFPKLRKLDFRAEGPYTPSVSLKMFPGFFYYNVTYKDGYTNNGNLLGNWIGREATGLQLWSTYWFTPRSMVQAYYREAHVLQEFLEGGQIHDYALRSDITIHSHLTASASLQYEHWGFPLLSPTLQNNFTASFGVTFWPKLSTFRNSNP